MSAQISSLSLKRAELCLVAMTGRFHADFLSFAAALTLSVRETAIAPEPL